MKAQEREKDEEVENINPVYIYICSSLSTYNQSIAPGSNRILERKKNEIMKKQSKKDKKVRFMVHLILAQVHVVVDCRGTGDRTTTPQNSIGPPSTPYPPPVGGYLVLHFCCLFLCVGNLVQGLQQARFRQLFLGPNPFPKPQIPKQFSKYFLLVTLGVYIVV